MINRVFSGTLSRRDMLRTASCGIGYLALADLCARAATPDPANLLGAKPPHFPPKAKRVIFMFMAGAPSHVDTFDYKPRLQTDNGKPADKGKGLEGVVPHAPGYVNPATDLLERTTR